MNWRKYHLIIGTLGLLLFALQGQYMARVLGLPELPDVQRMLYRSAHIYLMLVCAVNVGVGFAMTEQQRTGFLQGFFSLVLLLSPALLIGSFFTESSGETLDRPLAIATLYLIFLSAALLATQAIWQRLRKPSPG
jgi:hypothetical protein